MNTTGETAALARAELLEKADKLAATEVLITGAAYLAAFGAERTLRKLANTPEECDNSAIAEAIAQLQQLSSSVPRAARELFVETARTLQRVLESRQGADAPEAALRRPPLASSSPGSNARA